MISKQYDWGILIRVLFLFVTLLAGSFLVVTGPRIWLLADLPLVIFQVFDFYRFHRRTRDELDQFVESVHYRDFSRHFSLQGAPAELRNMRKGFNEINSAFKFISRERETQYQYLQKILELVNTGIISYDAEEGEIIWMNDALKMLLGIPYLKSIHSLRKRHEDLYEQLIILKNGESRIVTIRKDNNQFKVLIATTAFQTGDRVFRLVAFQNVDEVLDETESRAWQKLLSVMTHEIMNSVAPIASLAETLKKRLLETGDHTRGEDLELGIETIRRRSEGLLKFAETYRNLNKLSQPRISLVLVRDLFEHVHLLMQPTLIAKKISLEIILNDTSQTLAVDSNLLEQVLINLVLNAIDAVRDRPDPRIILSSAYSPDKRAVLKVSDNGSGMTEDVADKVFIPFFSTKKTGSGIGLSLCKQIMLLHHGNIQVKTIPGEGSTFRLQF